MCAVKASVPNKDMIARSRTLRPAGIGAEGRHDQSSPVGGEAAPAHRPSTLRDPRDRMEMAGDLPVACVRGGLVAERQRAERQRGGEFAADAVRRMGIVIARNPQPIATALQRRERGAVRRCHAQRSAAIVEAVAERDHQPRCIALDQVRHPRHVAACRRAAEARRGAANAEPFSRCRSATISIFSSGQ
jgi:hypothetical protein